MKLSINTPLSSKSRRFLWYLIGIATVALILRLTVSFQLKDGYTPVDSPSTQTDNFTYIAKGMETADGNYDYSKGYYYQPFYYAVFLPATFKVLGDGDNSLPIATRYRQSCARSVIIAQSAVGALTVVLCGLLASALFGRRCGLIAAVLIALARMPIFFTPFTLIATLQAFWLTLMAFFAVVAARKKSLLLFGCCGFVAGLGNLTRGNIIILLPLVILLAVWRLRGDWKKTALASAVVIACFVLPQLPFSLVNYRAHNRWVGPSSAGPAVLALGNTPEAPPGGREPHMGAGPMAYPPSYGLWMSQHEDKGEGHVSMASNILGWAKREPLAYLELKVRMLLLYWNRIEIPNNVSILQEKPSLVHGPFLLDFWLLGSLGVAGLIVTFWKYRKRPAIIFLALTVIGYSFSIVLFYILARFRVPMIPLLSVFGAMLLDEVWRRRKTLLKKDLLKYLLPLIAGVTLTCFGYQLYRYGWERQIMRLVRPDGVQVNFPDRRSIKDHGPHQFGGWTPIQVKAVSVRKAFSVSESSPWQPASTTRIKLFVASQSDQELGLQFRNHSVKKAVKSGVQWVTLEVPNDSVTLKTGGQEAVLEFGLQSLTGAPFFIYIDMQRQYQRSFLNGKPADGELVLETELYFDKERK